MPESRTHRCCTSIPDRELAPAHWLTVGILLVWLNSCAGPGGQPLLRAPDPDALLDHPRSNQHSILNVTWRFQLVTHSTMPIDHHHHGRPVVSLDGKHLFVGSHTGSFFCLDARTGEVVWRTLAMGPFDGPPTVYDDFVFAGSAAGRVYAFRASDGHMLWEYKVDAAVDGKPLIHGDRLLVTTDTNMLIALDIQTGRWLWTYRREVPAGRFQVKGVSNPLIVGQAVFVGFSDGTLAKINMDDGSLLAVKKLSGEKESFTDVDTDPLLADGKLLVASFGSGLRALNPDTLEEVWNYPAQGVSSVCAQSGVIFFSTADSKIVALRLEDGAPLWRFNARKGNLSRPVLAGKWLLVSSSEQSLLVLDTSDGRLLQIFNPGKGSSAPPTVDHGRVFWISNGQILYALGLYT